MESEKSALMMSLSGDIGERPVSTAVTRKAIDAFGNIDILVITRRSSEVMTT
jgi:hypothetical protein